ncbi:ParB-like protein [Eubacterium nodatum ATCC 33099]|nr:ParB-like protein [Eubacterium nodatum ATCC 33099]
MAKKEEINLNLPSVDDLFTTQKERDEEKLKKIYDIPLEEIDDFPNHPYKVKDDEDMMNLAESIREYGVITPATLRRKEDGRYEILSGHRRKRACELAGIKTLRAEIVEMSIDEAVIFMVDSNLQRTTILPSEKAFSYKMRLEAMNRQAGRPKKENLTPVVSNKIRTNEMLGEKVGESREQIRRYIRLTELIPELLSLVDEGKIALRPAVEISYFPKELQECLLENMQLEQCSPSHAQTLKMKRMFEEKKLTPEVIESIMQEEKPNQKEKLVLRDKRVQSLFPKDLPYSKREEYIIRAMEHYAKFKERQRKEKEYER